MDLSWNPTRMNASTLSTNTANSHTAQAGMRTLAGMISGARRDAAIANTTIVMIADRCSRSARIHTKNVVQNWNTTAVAGSVIRAFTISVSFESTMASTMLPTATTSVVGTTLQPEKNPVATAPTAKRYTSSALASLKRLSPSRITSSRCGGRSALSTVVAAAASGGATMAPSAIAAAQGMSGTSNFVTMATTTMVSATAPSARL